MLSTITVAYTLYKKITKVEAQVSEIVNLVNKRINSLEGMVDEATGLASETMSTLTEFNSIVISLHKDVKHVNQKLVDANKNFGYVKGRVTHLETKFEAETAKVEEKANDYIKSLID